MSLPVALERTLSTTNAIENLMGSVRARMRRVKRGRGGLRDGDLVTGQQNFSGGETARLVVETLGR